MACHPRAATADGRGGRAQVEGKGQEQRESWKEAPRCPKRSQLGPKRGQRGREGQGREEVQEAKQKRRKRRR